MTLPLKGIYYIPVDMENYSKATDLRCSRCISRFMRGDATVPEKIIIANLDRCEVY